MQELSAGRFAGKRFTISLNDTQSRRPGETSGASEPYAISQYDCCEMRAISGATWKRRKTLHISDYGSCLAVVEDVGEFGSLHLRIHNYENAACF